MGRVNVAVISPNHFFREGVRQLLRGTAYDVVADGASVRRSAAASGQFELHLLILGPGRLDNVEGEIASVRAYPAPLQPPRVVALMDIGDTEAVRWVAAQGVDSILSYSTPVEVFAHMLDMVMMGQHVFPVSPAQTHMPSRSAKSNMRGSGGASPLSAETIEDAGLTGREAEILNLLVHGASNKSIARQLLVTEPTVKAHVKGLLRKIRVTNRTQAAIWALNQAQSGRAPPHGRTAPTTL